MKITAALGIFCALATAAPSFGAIWAEVGDAGDLPGTAQTAAGLGPLSNITGTITGLFDADMYLIDIKDMASFSATTNIAPGTMTDTTLYLFNLDGSGVAKNDDITGTNFLSTLPVGGGPYANLPNGRYYLAIAGFAFAPSFVANATTTADLIFNVNDFTGVIGPQAQAVGMPVLSWANAGAYDEGTYNITLTGASLVTVPAPGAICALGLGGLMAARRRRA